MVAVLAAQKRRKDKTMRKDINATKVSTVKASSEKLTFRELKAKLKSTANKKLPTCKQLKESGSSIFLKRSIGDDTELTVYENGFVLYEKQTCEDEVTTTVFGVDRLGAVSYDSAVKMDDLRPEDYEDEDCMFRLVMEGEERIAHNRDKVQGDNIAFSISGDGSDWSVHEEPSYTDGEEDDDRENIHKLHEGLKNLTDRQRQVVLMYAVQGKTFEQIGNQLGMKKQSAKEAYDAGMKKLKKFF